MKNCPNCGAEIIHEEQSVCLECGEMLSDDEELNEILAKARQEAMDVIAMVKKNNAQDDIEDGDVNDKEPLSDDKNAELVKKHVSGLISRKGKKCDDSTFIGSLESGLWNTLKAIDQEIISLIKNGNEMQGLTLLSECLANICNLYDLLGGLYTNIYNSQEILIQCNSPRLEKLQYKMAFTPYVVSQFTNSPPVLSEEDFGIEQLKLLGIPIVKHWAINSAMLSEIFYFIATLNSLIEPTFTPLQEDQENETPERHIVKSVKIEVWQRDLGKCVECGSKEKLEYDHIIPISKGGSNTARNIQLLCEKCNRQKGAAIQ